MARIHLGGLAAGVFVFLVAYWLYQQKKAA
jgi:hypothetical protein